MVNFYSKEEDMIILDFYYNERRKYSVKAVKKLREKGYERTKASVDSRIHYKIKTGEIQPRKLKRHRSKKRRIFVPVTCVETGLTYPNMAEAGRATGIHGAAIAWAIRDPKCHTAGGLHWMDPNRREEKPKKHIKFI